MPLKDFRQRDADLRGEIAKATKDKAAIGEAALADKRAMTDEERAKFLAFTPVIEKLEGALAENAELLRAAEAANEAERQYRGPLIDPDADAAQKAAIAGGFQRVEVLDPTKQPGFFGRQLHAVHRFAIAHGDWGQLNSEDRVALKPMMAAATGLNTDVGSEGGFLVTQDRSTSVRQRMYEIGTILSRVTPIPISAGSNGIVLPAIDETSRADNSRYGGIISGWLGQGGALTAGKPKFRPMDLKLRKVGAFVYATDELLTDAVALEGWIDRYLPLELVFRVENAIVNGLGSTQPLGWLTSGAKVTVTRATASKVKSVDLRGMWKRLFAGCRANAVWYYDQSIEDQLDELSVPVGTAGVLDPSYKPAGSVPGQIYPTYKGRPMIAVEHCAALGTTGDIILVDPTQYILIDKGGVQQAVSLHVAFLTDEQVFRFMYRVDGQLSWNAALTPKSAGDSQTCCLVLS